VRIVFPSGLSVDALSRSELINRAVEIITTASASSRSAVITALHVGGLTMKNTPTYKEALKEADLICADGASIVLLARLARAREAERAPTTDVGIDILREAGRLSDAKLTVALVGGRAGLADSASGPLEKETGCEVVYVTNGYQDDWSPVITDLARLRPNVLVLGLGSPLETIWAAREGKKMPGTTILTCGGWFGFLAGDERRAPEIAQKTGLEWAYRLAQDPARLATRYVTGAFSTVYEAVTIVFSSARTMRREQ
jgi:N-acetylglucosaminyldiphosphoundecaprenol N-acetyl-beta-D-mannosaminyltransferase